MTQYLDPKYDLTFKKKTIENGVKEGYAIEIIADVTGLTTTELMKIIEEIKETNSS